MLKIFLNVPSWSKNLHAETKCRNQSVSQSINQSINQINPSIIQSFNPKKFQSYTSPGGSFLLLSLSTTNFCFVYRHYAEKILTQSQYIESYYAEIRYFRSTMYSVLWEKSFGLMTTFCVHYTEFGIVSILCKETIYFRYNGYSV